MNTHRLTPLQALTIANTGGQEHRDTDWGDTLYVNTQDQWDLGDHVAITVPPDNITLNKPITTV